MKRLHAPWRTEYITQPTPSGCFLCAALQDRRHDAANLVLYRGRKVFVIMNRFPYNNGHVMVVPNRHLDDVTRLTPVEYTELFVVLQRTLKVLRREMRPEGFNIGMNLGRVAGAGLADHIHLHVVPRWNGDTNFMPVTGETKVISEAFARTYERLHDGFQRITRNA